MTPAQMRRLAPAAILFVVFLLIGNAIAGLLWGVVLAVIAFALTPRILEWLAKPGGPLDTLAKQAEASAKARAAVVSPSAPVTPVAPTEASGPDQTGTAT